MPGAERPPPAGRGRLPHLQTLDASQEVQAQGGQVRGNEGLLTASNQREEAGRGHLSGQTVLGSMARPSKGNAISLSLSYRWGNRLKNITGS